MAPYRCPPTEKGGTLDWKDHKNQDRMSELAGKLQAKIKTYKKQIEEAEEIAALNLAKYRKAQQDLEETEERAKLAGANLTVARGGSIVSIDNLNTLIMKNP